MIIVTVRVTHHGKAGNLELNISDTQDFHLTDDAEGLKFAEAVKADPNCELVAYRTIHAGSARAATANLDNFKEGLALAF